jgi:hypothetical protein
MLGASSTRKGNSFGQRLRSYKLDVRTARGRCMAGLDIRDASTALPAAAGAGML